jgi:hypothetical protein
LKLKILLFLFVAFVQTCFSGGLSLLNHSVAFTGNTRKEIVKFVNSSDDTLKYAISFVDRIMSEAGRVEAVPGDKAPMYSASRLLRVYPRSIVLSPREAQTVVLQIRRDANMKPGEYRSHLLFQQVDNTKEELVKDDEIVLKGVATEVSMLMGTTIPVFVFTDELEVFGKIENLRYNPNSPDSTISYSVIRSGNRSIRGALTVEHISPSGESTELAKRTAVVYRELDKRDYSLSLKEIPQKGTLRIRLNQKPIDEKSDDLKLLDEIILKL